MTRLREVCVVRRNHGASGIFIMGATGESPRRLTDFGFDPAWSPDGKQLAFATEHVEDPLARIACWRNGQGGQRDLFTMASDGTDLVEVTSDAPTDWNPVWSPDGKWLYFCSDRGGSFAIWRIAIDELRGTVSGAPEQVTTSTSAGAGSLSFSRDGKRLIFSSSSAHAFLKRLDLDPVTGEPRTLTPFTTNVAMQAISPDGRFIAYFNGGERQEDLFIISSDGTGRRRITNDAAKDRGPKWLGDGDRLSFYSDRNGKHRAWTIDTDGGGLELLAENDLGFSLPLVSPDGKFVAGTNNVTGVAQLIRLGEGDDRAPKPLPPHPGGFTFSACLDWSSDSSKLLVLLSRDDLESGVLNILDIETGVYKPIGTASAGLDAKFYSDPRYVLFGDGMELLKLDTETGQVQSLYTELSGKLISLSIDLAPDDSWICYTKSEVEADIWMIEFEEP